MKAAQEALARDQAAAAAAQQESYGDTYAGANSSYDARNHSWRSESGGAGDTTPAGGGISGYGGGTY